ncbi:MAG: helix-turn-helix domain-containing protein [Thermodesulfovibrionales bacterium]
MKTQNEYEERYKAIQLYKEGYGFNKILQLLQRSRRWLSKWIKRYKEHGIEGLKSQSRVPKRIWRKTPEHMVKKILSIRAELEAHKSRRSAFSGIGAETISWELKQRRFKNFHLSLLLPESSLIMEKPRKLRPKKITAIINLILLSGQRRWETSIRQTLLDQDTSEAPKVLPDSIPFTLWMLQGIQPSQVSLLINRLSLCANIWLRHGDIWGFLMCPRLITRCLLQEEDVIPTASLILSVFTCFLEYIWYSFRRENQVEMPLLRVLMPSGRKGYLEDIIVLHLLLLEDPGVKKNGVKS